MNKAIQRVYNGEVNCTICKEMFIPTSKRENLKYCSDECRRKAARTSSGRVSLYKDIPAGTVGAISELVAATYFMENGWQVFRALSPACFCDLVIRKGNEQMYLEVRTGYRAANGSLTFPRAVREGVTHYAVVLHNENMKVELISI